MQSELGQTMAEYGLILAVIVVATVGVLTLLGTQIIGAMLATAAGMF